MSGRAPEGMVLVPVEPGTLTISEADANKLISMGLAERWTIEDSSEPDSLHLLAASPDTPVPNGGEWRCFHCDEVFTTPECAVEHFGPSETCDPACQIDIKKYREMEEIHQRHLTETDEATTEFHRMRADHAQSLIREEEKGYAKGLADARAEQAEVLTEARTEIEALIRAIYTRASYSDQDLVAMRERIRTNKAITKIDAMLIHASNGGEWQDMDSAPKDGSTILACSRYSDTAFTVRWGSKGWESVWDGWHVISSQTDFGTDYQEPDPLLAWQPLPTPSQENPHGNEGER